MRQLECFSSDYFMTRCTDGLIRLLWWLLAHNQQCLKSHLPTCSDKSKVCSTLGVCCNKIHIVSWWTSYM